MYETISIPAAVGANPGIYNLYGRASVFSCISASAEFRVVPDNQGEFKIQAGRGFGTQYGRPWSRLTFYNDTGTIITAQIYYGNEPFVPAAISANVSSSVTTSGKDATSYTKASNCPANATTTFNGTDGAYVRKQFAVWNDNAVGGANITIMDNAGTAGFKVAPQSGFTMPTNGIFKVNVPAGSNPALVMETFYL